MRTSTDIIERGRSLKDLSNLVMISTGGASAALGLLVLVGWYTHNVTLGAGASGICADAIQHSPGIPALWCRASVIPFSVPFETISCSRNLLVAQADSPAAPVCLRPVCLLPVRAARRQVVQAGTHRQAGFHFVRPAATDCSYRLISK